MASWMSTDIGTAPGAQTDSVWFIVGWWPLYRKEFKYHLSKVSFRQEHG